MVGMFIALIVFGKRMILNAAELSGPDVLPTYEGGIEDAIDRWSRLNTPRILNSYPVASSFCDSYIIAIDRHQFMERYQCPEG